MARAALFVVFACVPMAGCIELGFLLGGELPNGNPIGGDGDGLPNGNDNDNSVLAVALSVSNPTPQVNEQVFLACEVLSGDDEGVDFDFQPASARLSIDRNQGTATFVVQESDAGQAFTFACAAENDAGEIATSSSVTITPNL